MAEVTRVFGRMQLDTEGGLVPATASGFEGLVVEGGSVPLYSRGWRRSKLVKDDSAVVGATKAGRKMAVARNKSVGSFTGEIGVTKAELGNKEAAGSLLFDGSLFEVDFTTKAELGNKDAAGSFGEVDFTKADLANKEAGSRGDVEFTKVEVGNMLLAWASKLPEKKWIQFVFPVIRDERKAAAEIEAAATSSTVGVGGMVTKEKVPDCIVDKLKNRRAFTKLPALDDREKAYSAFPETRDICLYTMAVRNFCIDLQADIVRQDAEKGFAEVGVDFTDGVKKLFILPQD